MKNSTIGKLITVSGVAMAFAACGSDGPTYQKAQIDDAQASAAITNLAGVRMAMTNGDGSAVADRVMSLTAGGESLLAPPSGSAAAAVIPRGLLLKLATRPAPRESFTGSATCDDSGCTYDHFADSGDFGTFELDGSIHATANSISVDLTMTITSSDGLDMTWALDGALTVTASEIDGNFHAHGDANDAQSQTSITWDESVDYNAIGLDASGCPISGSLSAQLAYSGHSPQGGGSLALEGGIGFGPACGQYTAL